MKVLLINPIVERYPQNRSVPLGLLSIATYLKNSGHTVSVFERSTKRTNLKKHIDVFSPDIVGVSVMGTKSVADAVRVSKLAHGLGLPVVWGGTFVHTTYGMFLEKGFADYVIMSEGEESWRCLIEAIETKSPLAQVEGLVFRENGTLIKNKDRDFLPPEKLPVIDWSFVNPADYFSPYIGCKKMSYVYSGKGCPFQCTFCFNKNFHRCKYRRRPIENVIAEIEALVNNYGADGIYFADELWAVSSKEAKENCQAYMDANARFVWGCQLRIGILNKEDYELMYKSGCRWIYFGVESGSKERLQKLKKEIDYDKIYQSAKDAHDSGISVMCGFITGFHDETVEELRETVSLAKKLPGSHGWAVLTPFPCTELFDELVQKGLYTFPTSVKKISSIKSTDQAYNGFSSTSSLDLQVLRAHFFWEVFVSKDSAQGARPYANLFKYVMGALRSLFEGGIGTFFYRLFRNGFYFLQIVFFRFFFPKTRKKYNLDD